MTAPDRRNGDNVLVFPEADKLSFFQNSSWSDFGSASKDFSPQMPRRQAAPARNKPRRRNSMIETYGSHSHSELFTSSSSHEDVFGSDLMAADPWVDFKDEFGMSEHCNDRDDSFNTTDITSDSSEGDFAGDEEEQFTLHFPSAEAARGEGTMPLRDHNAEKSRLVSRGRQGRRKSPRPPANEGPKRRNRSRSKPSFVAPTHRRTRSLSVPKKPAVIVDQQEKSSSSHSRKTPTESLPTAKGKKNRSEEKSRKTKGDKSTKAPKAPSDKSPKTPSDRSRKTPKTSKDKALKGSKDKSQKTPKAPSDKAPKTSKDKSAKSTKVSRSKSPKRDKSDKSPKVLKPSRSKSPVPSRSKSPMAARDRSSRTSRSKSPMAARDRSARTSRSKSPMAARDKSSKTSRSKSPMAASKISRSKSPMTARDRSTRTSRSKSPVAARDRSSKTSRSKSPMAARDRSSKTSRSKSPMAARDRSSKTSRDRSLKANSEDKSLKSYATDSTLPQALRKQNGIGTEKKKAQTLFASPLPPKSYLSRGTQKRCYAGFSKEIDKRQNNIKESLANLLCDDDGSFHRKLLVDDEESVHSSTERKRSSSVPKRSGSESSRSEQMETQQVPTQRHRRYRRHSIIGSSPSDVAKRVPATMTRPRSAEMLMGSSGHSKHSKQ